MLSRLWQFLFPAIKAIDGDTLKIKGVSYRLWGIDCPEKTQRSGLEAKAFLQMLIKDIGRYRIELVGNEATYGRKVARIYGQGGTVDIASVMVREGYAWDAPTYSKGYYAEDMRVAKQLKRGIWKQSGNVNPSVFRKAKRKRAV